MPDLAAAFYRAHHAGATGFARYGFTIGGGERVRWFQKRLNRGGRLLDIGCRDGTMTRHWIDGNTVVGIDLDEEALRRAKENLGIETRAVNLNVSSIPFEDSSFDAVLAGEVIEHLQFPELVVRDVYRVLKPNGLFLGSVPNAFRLYNRLRFLLGKDFETDPTHLHHFSPESVSRLLSAYSHVEIDFICSRHLWLSPRLMGTDLVWACRKSSDATAEQ